MSRRGADGPPTPSPRQPDTAAPPPAAHPPQPPSSRPPPPPPRPPARTVARPTAAANSIAWLIWHSARQQDLQLCNLAGVEQVWTRDGWDDRFGLDLEGNDHGYGHSADDVGKVRVPADLLAGYYHAVHKATLEYIASVTAEELGRVVDTHWTPPVTASARLISIVDDAAQHLGQAAYIRGIAA